MPSGLNKTKHRINSVKSTQKITKAMGMVATVKLKRFKDAFEADDAYQSEIVNAMARLFYYDAEEASHYSKENENAKGSLYIVITSNLGLCAGYNNNLFKFVDEIADPKLDTIAPIGEKGKAHFRLDERYQNVSEAFSDLDLSIDTRLIEKAAYRLKGAFNSKQYKRIVFVYTRYVNSLTFTPNALQALPVSLKYEPTPEEAYCPPLFEPSPRELIHKMMPQYLFSLFYSKLVEAQLSEQASRRTAMDSANDNADELLAKLTIEYNKARQSAITSEIVEVVAGANASGK